MTDFFLPPLMAEELAKIASTRAHQDLFTALDKLAANDRSCRRCRCTIRPGAKVCPRCGTGVQDVEGLGGKDDQAEEGSTGREAAENEAAESLESGKDADTGKTAAVQRLRNAAGALPPEVAAILSLGGGTYGAIKMRNLVKDLEAVGKEQQKSASVGKRAVINIRKPHVLSQRLKPGVTSPSESLAKLRQRVRRSRRSVASEDL